MWVWIPARTKLSGSWDGRIGGAISFGGEGRWTYVLGGVIVDWRRLKKVGKGAFCIFGCLLGWI